MYKIETRDQLEAYKANWLGDPCWDQIDKDVDAPAAWLDELRAFEQAQVAKWVEDKRLRLMTKAFELGCVGNMSLAQYVLTLESKIESLIARIEKLEGE